MCIYVFMGRDKETSGGVRHGEKVHGLSERVGD